MPTKHIPENTWRKIEKETVKAVIETKKAVKDTEVLNYIILKGIEKIKEDGYNELGRKKP